MKHIAVVASLLLAAVVVAGCQVTMPGSPKVAGSPGTPPNYDMPEAEFNPADFNKLGSEFLDEYVGQYVVFEGRYFNHAQGSMISAPSGRIQTYGDLMYATIGAPMSSGSVPSSRMVIVHWMVDDRELGRPFLNLAQGGSVRIYGYVLPAHTAAKIKSRRDRFMSGLPSPIVLLVKAEPVQGK